MESNLNVGLILRSLNFHGQQLQKTWESELGDNLSKLNVPEPNYTVYQQRQKQLSFQDRGKRLKLHDFIVKNSSFLFDHDLQKKDDNVEVRGRLFDPSYFAVLPPYETFLSIDPQVKTQHFLSSLKLGDILIASVTAKTSGGLILKVLCSDGEVVNCVSDVNVKAFIPSSKLIPATGLKRTSVSFMVHDNICCEVLDVYPDSEKLICGMKGNLCAPEVKAKLGLISSEDFPEVYKKFQEPLTESFSSLLHKSVGFFNPSCINNLSNAVGLGSKQFSHFPHLKVQFPVSEFASELRQVQAGKWAYRSVAYGIEYFKAGKHPEAFQCLNKALQIDPRNIEGLVARGALYANSSNFKKAVDDFESALKLNPGHQNARKYLGETLVAYGRSYEEENKYEDALKCYESCLVVIPYHEEAQNSIEFLKKNHLGGFSKKLDPDLPFPQITASKALEVKDTLKQLLGEHESKDKAKKKKKEKKLSRHHRSSSSSSSSSSDSSSASSSSSSSSSSDTSHESAVKKKKKKNDKKDHSLSPLSKRMATMDAAVTDLGGILAQTSSHYNPSSEVNSFTSSVNAPSVVPLYQLPVTEKVDDKESEYEQRVRKFLEQTKGDDDYEEKVRKFLDETAKWKKEQKLKEEKAKKKKKKEKKSREKGKRKKRDEKKKRKVKEQEDKKSKRKQRSNSSPPDSSDDLPNLFANKPELSKLLGLSRLPDLEELQKSLTAYYSKLEKEASTSVPSKKKDSEKRTSSSNKSKSKPPPLVSPVPKRDYGRDLDVDVNGKSRSEKKKADATPTPRPKERSKTPPIKFKMQMNSSSSWSKKKEKEKDGKDQWVDRKEKRYFAGSDDSDSEKISAKKGIDTPPKKMTLMDKLGGFRMNLPESRSDSKSSAKPAKKRVLSPSRSPDSAKRSFSRSRSRSRQRRKYSRSPSRSSSSRSRSNSYPNRVRKYRSRSRSRSRSFSRSYSGSRSGSRSRSPDYRSRMAGRYQRGGRGTYYRPRPFNSYGNRGGFVPRGRGRNHYFQHRDYHDYRGRGNYSRPRGRGRSRFMHYQSRDSRDSRDYRDHESYRSRRSKSYDDDDDVDDRSPMTKVDEAKERINKILASKRNSEGQSGSEEKEDVLIERKNFDGKWAQEEADATSN